MKIWSKKHKINIGDKMLGLNPTSKIGEHKTKLKIVA
jgi:hypothetical protein